MQSFVAHIPLRTATSTFGLVRSRWSFPQQCCLRCLHALDIVMRNISLHISELSAIPKWWRRRSIFKFSFVLLMKTYHVVCVDYILWQLYTIILLYWLLAGWFIVTFCYPLLFVWSLQAKCPLNHPPGNEIYRKANLSFFEIDGRKNKVI